MKNKVEVKDYNYYVNKFAGAEKRFKVIEDNENRDYLEVITDAEEIAGYYLEQYGKDAFYEYSKNTIKKPLKSIDDIRVYDILSKAVKTIPGYRKITLLERYLQYVDVKEGYRLADIKKKNDIDMYVGLFLIIYKLNAFKELERQLEKRKLQGKEFMGIDAYAYIILSELE